MEAIDLGRSGLKRHSQPAASESPALRVHWARCSEDVRAAQRLRHQVFAQEMGAQLPPPGPDATGLDQDVFDDYCEHLLVSTIPADDEPARVVGTYRVLLPQSAQRIGRYYTEAEFDMAALETLRPHLAELGRSCIAAPWRTGSVIMMLWGHLLRFLLGNGVRHVVGCASIPMADGGLNAARIWREVQRAHLTPDHLRVQPRVALPVQLLNGEGPVEWPALIKGYLRCGSRVMGAPAWDAGFGTADLPMLLDMGQMSPAYRKRFSGT